MLRALTELEQRILIRMCPAVATAAFLRSCQAASLNSDNSIVDFQLPDACLLGENIVELAHGLFRDSKGDVCGFALLLGDEKGFPRQLDLHGVKDGLTVDDLAALEFLVLD